MRTLNVLIVLLISTSFALAQNESVGGVQPFINNPPPQFGGQEIFRFKSGVVSQLDAGTFNVGSSDRWFSQGRLFTGSSLGYGFGSK